LAPVLLLVGPIFLAFGVGFLELAPPLELAVVAFAPFAAAAGGQEHADEEAEQEDQRVNDQNVRIGREAHVASPTKMDSRRLRLSAPPRSNRWETEAYLPCRKLSLIEQLAGPRMT